jgi:hypothetical protein
MDCWVSHNGSRRAKQCPMEWVLAVRKRSLVALPDPRLVLTTPKDGVIGLPDRLTRVNTTSRKPIDHWFTRSAGQAPGITRSNDCRGQIVLK